MTRAIDVSSDDRRRLATGLRAWLSEELDLDITGLQAEMLLDEVTRRLGPAVYNQALYDAQTLLAARIEALGEDLLSLERPVPR